MPDIPPGTPNDLHAGGVAGMTSTAIARIHCTRCATLTFCLVLAQPMGPQQKRKSLDGHGMAFQMRCALGKR
jgi:hypothetical protein